MAGHILIAYTSRAGSTAEIANAMGIELEAMGISVTVARMEGISSIGGFQVVVIGTPVYMGKPVREVAKFVVRHREKLLKIPVAAFAVGMAAVDPKVGSVEGVMKHLLAALDPIQPAAITVFAGRLDPSRMSFIDRTMTALMKVRTGDFRDWNAIAAWVRTLPALLNR